jgi:AraC family transcriptional regulator of adaptative response/methylated-DNA-[protein]-cysteine methyltransferase
MSDYARIEKVIRHLGKSYLEQPSLHDLALVAGVSEYHFHRLFTRWAGITPKDFVKYLTANHAKALLCQSKDLLSVSLESGLSGPGRLHDLMVSVEAVTPGEFKSKGQGVKIQYGFHDSPFGKILLANTTRGICFISFCEGEEARALDELHKKWANADIKLQQRSTAGMAKKLFLPRSTERFSVLLMGTPFQLKVWESLILIPEGHLLSYTDIAKISGCPKSARAVGSAVGDNAIAYLVPCHRVIRESGHFSEYRWDPVRKKAILAWERGSHESV